MKKIKKNKIHQIRTKKNSLQSIMKHSFPDSKHIPIKMTIFGCLSFAINLTSRTNDSILSPSTTNNFLTATSRPRQRPLLYF
jgi:hypothetical protein